MIILGIDPGSITTGYAFIRKENRVFSVLEYGTIHASSSKKLEDRLIHIIAELEKLLDFYKPEALAMEGVFFAKNAKSALVLGHIRGAILVACRKRNMTFSEYPPKVVKQAVTGNGSASKELVATMVYAHLGIQKSEVALDATDALAIAWTYGNPISMADIYPKKKSKRNTKTKWLELINKMGVSLEER